MSKSSLDSVYYPKINDKRITFPSAEALEYFLGNGRAKFVFKRPVKNSKGKFEYEPIPEGGLSKEHFESKDSLLCGIKVKWDDSAEMNVGMAVKGDYFHTTQADVDAAVVYNYTPEDEAEKKALKSISESMRLAAKKDLVNLAYDTEFKEDDEPNFKDHKEYGARENFDLQAYIDRRGAVVFSFRFLYLIPTGQKVLMGFKYIPYKFKWLSEKEKEEQTKELKSAQKIFKKRPLS